MYRGLPSKRANKRDGRAAAFQRLRHAQPKAGQGGPAGKALVLYDRFEEQTIAQLLNLLCNPHESIYQQFGIPHRIDRGLTLDSDIHIELMRASMTEHNLRFTFLPMCNTSLLALRRCSELRSLFRVKDLERNDRLTFKGYGA